ncbi:hypothetical protein GCM10010455_26080 [Microbacterium esteraromaticum]
MGQIVAQERRQLQGGGRSADHHHRHRTVGARVGLVETLIDERLPQPILTPAVDQVDPLDPERRRGQGILDQHGSQRSQHPPRVLARRSDAVRDDVERAEPDASLQTVEQQLDPRADDFDAGDALESELHRVLVAPQQRIARIEAGQSRRAHRAHDPIVSCALRPASAVRRSVDGSPIVRCCAG